MKVVTWNILAVEFVKKSHYPKLNIDIINDRLNRIKKISKHIKSLNPDLLLLQEVMDYEYKYLKNKLNNYYFSDLCKIDWKDYKKSESGNVILYKKGKLFSQNVNFSKLFHNGMIFGVRVGLSYKNNIIHVINLHLDDAHSQTRNAQLNSIREMVNENKYCIIGGDFNQEYKKDSKLYNINHFIVNNECPSYYIEKNINIDNILTKGFYGIKNNKCINFNLYLQNDVFEYFGSDHIPVIANLTIA